MNELAIPGYNVCSNDFNTNPRGIIIYVSQDLTCKQVDFNSSFIIDFPNLGSTYNGGWCLATETDETRITRPSCEVNVK